MRIFIAVNIRINGRPVDVDTNTEVVLSLRRGKEGGRIQGSYSLTLRLPKTSANLRVLQVAGHVAQQGVYLRVDNLPITVDVSGQTVIDGAFRVSQITETTIDGNIIDGAVSWVELLKGRSLRDITFPTVRYSGARGTNRNDWPSSVEANTVALHELWDSTRTERPFCMPLVAYGNFPALPGSGLHPFQQAYPGVLLENSGGLEQGNIILNTQANPMSWARFRPACYMLEVVRTLFEQAGIPVGGQFFSKAGPFADYTEMVVPFTGKGDGEWNWGILAQYAWAGPATPLNHNSFGVGFGVGPIVTENAAGGRIGYWILSPGGKPVEADYLYDYSYGGSQLWWPVTGGFVHQFVAPVDGRYRVQCTFDVTAAENGFFAGGVRDRLIFMLRKYPGLTPITTAGANTEAASFISDDNYIATGTLPTAPDILDYDTYTKVIFPDGRGTVSFALDTGFIDLRKGEAVSPIMAALGEDFSQPFYNSNVYIANLTMEVTAEGNKELQPARFLPDIPQEDFVRSLIALFNLQLTYRGGTLSIDAAANDYNGAVPDWTNKCGPITTLPPALSRVNTLSYTAQGGDAIVAPTSTDVSASYVVAGTRYTGQTTVSARLAYTGQRVYWVYDPVEQYFYDVWMGCLNTGDELAKTLGALATGEEDESRDYLPRLLYLDVRSNTAGSQLWVNGQAIAETYVGPGYSGAVILPYLRNVVQDSTGNRFPMTASALLDAHYTRQLIQQEAGVRGRCTAMLAPSDISALDIAGVVRIDNQLWRVLEVADYKATSPQPVTITLERI